MFMQHHKTSVLLDATKYIQGLKQKLAELNQLQVAKAQTIIDNDPMPKVLTYTNLITDLSTNSH